VSYDVYCRGETDEGEAYERAIDRATYDEFHRWVVESEPDTWADEYPCEGECATDVGWVDVAVNVGGVNHGTTVRSDATLPPRIEQLRSVFQDLGDRFDDVEECPDTWTDRR
jgi:hypothetical protein